MPIDKSKQQQCDSSGRAYAGSQRLIQFYVNEKPNVLNRAIEDAFDRRFGLRWVSPLKSDDYREYRDEEFLTALAAGSHGRKLNQFWPKSGPRWDALACVEVGAGGVLLVEAKSHIPEMYAAGCKATSPESINKIHSSIAQTKRWVGANASNDWLGRHPYQVNGGARKGSLYQMANRIAHLYFFREVLAIDAWLVNLCFINDPHCQTTEKEWEAGLAMARAHLGIGDLPFMADIFLTSENTVTDQ